MFRLGYPRFASTAETAYSNKSATTGVLRVNKAAETRRLSLLDLQDTGFSYDFEPEKPVELIPVPVSPVAESKPAPAEPKPAVKRPKVFTLPPDPWKAYSTIDSSKIGSILGSRLSYNNHLENLPTYSAATLRNDAILHPLQLLGLPETASFEEAERAYTLLRDTYTLQSNQLGEEINKASKTADKIKIKLQKQSVEFYKSILERTYWNNVFRLTQSLLPYFESLKKQYSTPGGNSPIDTDAVCDFAENSPLDFLKVAREPGKRDHHKIREQYLKLKALAELEKKTSTTNNPKIIANTLKQAFDIAYDQQAEDYKAALAQSKTQPIISQPTSAPSKEPMVDQNKRKWFGWIFK